MKTKANEEDGGVDTAASVVSEKEMELIACAGCGRSFFTTDGPGMLTAITGGCPDCGGEFELVL